MLRPPSGRRCQGPSRRATIRRDVHTPLGPGRARARRRRRPLPRGRGPPDDPARRRRAVHVHARRRAPVRDAPDADRGADVHGSRRDASSRWTSRCAIRATPGSTTTEPDRGTAGNFELWIGDGETVRTFSGTHRLGTSRPVRNRPRGLDGDFPGPARVYEPITPLPLETLPELFVHPAGYCQNVLATGRTWISGTDVVAGREAIVLECDHPRAIERVADRPDFHVQVAVDRLEGIITRLVETIGGDVTPRRRGHLARAGCPARRPGRSTSSSPTGRRCSSEAGPRRPAARRHAPDGAGAGAGPPPAGRADDPDEDRRPDDRHDDRAQDRRVELGVDDPQGDADRGQDEAELADLAEPDAELGRRRPAAGRRGRGAR